MGNTIPKSVKCIHSPTKSPERPAPSGPDALSFKVCSTPVKWPYSDQSRGWGGLADNQKGALQIRQNRDPVYIHTYTYIHVYLSKRLPRNWTTEVGPWQRLVVTWGRDLKVSVKATIHM